MADAHFTDAELQEKRRKHAAYMREYYKRKGRTRNRQQDRDYAAQIRRDKPEVVRERVKRSRAKYKDKYNAARRGTYKPEHYQRWKAKKLAEDPLFFKKLGERDRVRYARTRMNGHLKRRFGLTIEEYEVMHAKQRGVCDICKKAETRKRSNGTVGRLMVDHCHATGKVRSLLCHQCNMLLGNAEDRISRLTAAIAYLRKHRNKRR